MKEQGQRTEAAHPASAGSLARGLASGMAWTAGARFISQGLSWLSTLLLVRLLTPEDYGIAAIAFSVSTFLAVASEFGVGALVRARPGLRLRDYRALHLVVIAAGTATALVMALCSPLIARYFKDIRLTEILQVLAFALAVDSFRAVPAAVLARRLDYRRIATIDFSRNIAQTVAVLTLALIGFRYRALVYGAVFGSLVAAVVTLRFIVLRPAFWGWRRLKSQLVDAASFMVGSISWQAYWNFDTLIIGRVMGAAALGAYSMSKLLASLPGEKLANLITSQSQSTFAAADGAPIEQGALLTLILESIAWAVALPLAGLFAAAPLLSAIILGPRWQHIAPIVRILTPALLVWSFAPLFGQVVSSSPQFRLAAKINVFAVPVTALSFWLSTRTGSVEFAAFGLWPTTMIITGANALIACRHTQLTGRAIFVALREPLAVAAAVAIAGSFGEMLLRGQVPDIACFAAVLLTCAACCVIGVLRSRSRVLQALRAVAHRYARSLHMRLLPTSK